MKRNIFFVLATVFALCGLTQDAWAIEKVGNAYQIATAQDWIDFTELVKEDNTIDAVMTADVELGSGVNAQVGNYGSGLHYAGTFDGQGHTLTVHYNLTTAYTAPFHSLSGVVKNLRVAGDMFGSNSFLCGVVGVLMEGRVMNCISDVAMSGTKSGDSGHGGVVGAVRGSGMVINCGFVGSIDAPQASNSAGIVGWTVNYYSTTIQNCYSAGRLNIGTASSYTIARNPSYIHLQNVYYVNQLGNLNNQGEVKIDSAQVASGELCFRLNANQSDVQWYQTIGVDAYPLPFKNNSARVYAQGYSACAGTPGEGVEYTNTAQSLTPHNYVNGVCSVCGMPQLDYMTPAADGFYEIATAEQLSWFSVLVSYGGYETANARLTADIDMNGVGDFRCIGGHDEGHRYRGTFDGQFHTISNLTINSGENFTGLFGTVGSDADIKNLRLDSTCSISGGSYVGLVGGIRGSGTIRLTNLGNEGNVTASGPNAAGILGCTVNSLATPIINYTYSTGSIRGSHESAGLSAWIKNGSVSNSWSIATVEGIQADDRYIVRLDAGSVNNCYSLNGTQGTHIEDVATIPTGEFCYLLNGNQSIVGWFQNLSGTPDAYPVPFSNHGQVYRNGALRCDGEPLGDDVTYSNSPNGSTPPHQFEDGFCTVCGNIQTDYLTQTDGFYLINNAKELCWFAKAVSEYGFRQWNARLVADIDMTGYEETFIPIGNTTYPFIGTFDGGFHTISNLYVDSTSDFVGFIGLVNGGATVENLVLDETCYIRGGVGVGLVGGARVAGTVSLRYLGMEGYVEAFSKNGGGILGANNGSNATIVMENCYVTGVVLGTTESGSISGWVGNNGARISNCWSIGSCSGTENDEKYLLRWSGNLTLTNCYGVFGTQGNHIELEDAETGALAYRLNGDQKEIIWRQNLDNGSDPDAHPVFFADHGRVYPVVEYLCDGTFDAESATYSNNGDVVIPPHEFKDGFCENCGQEDPDYPFVRVITNPDYATSGGWEDLTGNRYGVEAEVAEHWNQGDFTTYQDITGLQKGVYKLRVQGYQRASSWDNATYYSEGVLNPDYFQLQHNSQYFAEVGGKRVASLFMDIADGRQYTPLRGETEPYNETTGQYVPDSRTTASIYFNKGIYWNEPLYFAVTDDTLRIGVHNNMYVGGNWTVWDRWRLEYVGDDAASYDLIRNQQVAEIQDLSDLSAQTSLVEAYAEVESKMSSASSPEEILEVADQMARLPEQIRLSHLAYQDYETAIEALKELRSTNEELHGPFTDLLDDYFNENIDESDENYPHGTFMYIMETKLLDVEELAEEVKFASQLYENALRANPTPGTDISSLLTNPGFDQDTNFAGWTTEVSRRGESGSNFNSNSGFTDIYPVAGTWNTAFYVEQSITGLPNGIYELETPAFYRPGGNGQGEYDGTDVVPADLYVNDFYTPVMNIYTGQILYADAINGVNCRFDPNEPGTPHAGENTSSIDFDTGTGYVPEQRQAVSIAFGAGRYINKVYGIVTDSTLTVGIRNTGTPWYDSGMTMWGRFKVVYRGFDEEVMTKMFDEYEQRIEMLAYQREYSAKYYYFAVDHIDTVHNLIDAGRNAASAEEKMAYITKINAEFTAIRESYLLYAKILELTEYAIDMAAEANDKLAEDFYSLVDDLTINLQDGVWSDEEAAAQYKYLMEESPLIGGVIWIQGDLADESAEDGNWEYANNKCLLYPMYKNAEGKWEGTFKMQDRSNRANANGRGGMYFMHMGTDYRCYYSSVRFVTPGFDTFVVRQGGSDFQMTGGEFKAVLDVDFETGDGTVTFESLDYKWNNQVYVAGSIYDKKGTAHRYVNDEAVPLQHVGNGVYTGIVNIYNDTSTPGYGTFTILATRSTEDAVNYATTTRSNWTEARYGSDENQLLLEDGVAVDSLVRGQDRKWRVSPIGEYFIEFDMNHQRVTATLLNTKGTGTSEDPYIVATLPELRSMQDRLKAGETTYFKFDADFDMNGLGWWPLNSTSFGNAIEDGTKYVAIDGGNHIIKSFAPAANSEENGFFGTLAGSVKNVGFWNANVAGSANATGVLAAQLGAAEYAGTTTVENSYFAGNVEAQGVAGGVAGATDGSVSINDVYAVVNVKADDAASYTGGLVGEVRNELSVQNSYAAGEVAGSNAGGIVGRQTETAAGMYNNVVVWNSTNFGSTGANAMQTGVQYFDGSNQAALCNAVSAWAAWNSNGTIGNGYPILEWQVARGDYQQYCGFGDSNAIELVQGSRLGMQFAADEVVTAYNAAGQAVFHGRAADMRVKSGLYLVKGQTRSAKVMMK